MSKSLLMLFSSPAAPFIQRGERALSACFAHFLAEALHFSRDTKEFLFSSCLNAKKDCALNELIHRDKNKHIS